MLWDTSWNSRYHAFEGPGDAWNFWHICKKGRELEISQLDWLYYGCKWIWMESMLTQTNPTNLSTESQASSNSFELCFHSIYSIPLTSVPGNKATQVNIMSTPPKPSRNQDWSVRKRNHKLWKCMKVSFSRVTKNISHWDALHHLHFQIYHRCCAC